MTCNACVRLDSSHAPAARAGWFSATSAPLAILRCDTPTLLTTLSEGATVSRQWQDPLAALRYLEHHITTQRPDPQGRWIGYLSYDLGRLFEHLPSRAMDDLQLPLFVFAYCGGKEDATHRPLVHLTTATTLTSTFTRQQYLAAVSRAIRYVQAGDIYQVNLSQRFTVPLPRHPMEIYQQLLNNTPASYGAYLDYADHLLLSNSPELFLSVTTQADGSRKVVTRPIKGTRPGLPGMDIELRDSIKDQAELNMIVDLERNDLGRVCHIGSVKVTQPRVIESHPTVYHGVATIEGVLREDVGFVDLLRATFPGGSITGAPKIRAMQIIEELEPVRRGPYCGAIGYLAADGTIQFNIAIRTMIVKEGLVHVPVGGAIVADSVPAQEYDETLVKAQAMFAALGVG